MAFTYTKRKDGRLMKRVSVNGRLETLYSNDPNDLERQYIEKKHLSHKGIYAEDNGLTVEEWSHQWLKSYKSDRQQATKDMYSLAINNHINPVIGNIRLKYLKENDITNMLNKLNNTPREKEIVFLTVKQILDKAVNNDFIYRNVADKITIKKHKSKEKKPLTDLEISYVKKIAEQNARCFMILFMIYTGLRREEVAPLTYKDIDLNNRMILINKAVHWHKNKPQIKYTKNEDCRKVPILNVIFENIVTLKSQHKESDLLFPAVNSKKLMSETSIKRLLESCLTKINKQYRKDQLNTLEGVSDEEKNNAEIKEIYFTYHQLRHTYVCILHKAGIDIKQAQSWVGDKTLKVLLEVYTHLDEEDNKKSVDKVNNFLN